MRTPVGVPPTAMQSKAVFEPERYVSRIMKYVEKGASLVSVSYTCPLKLEDYPLEREPSHRWGILEDSHEHAKSFRYLAILADEETIMQRIDVGVKILKLLKEKVPSGVVVQADIVGVGDDVKSWTELAKVFQEAGAELIELDVSCPYFAFHESSKWSALIKGGFPSQLLADSEEALPKVIEAIAQSVKVPFGWKMTPETGWPRFLYLAKATLDKGAHWVTCTNLPLTFSPISVWNDGKPSEKYFPGAKANSLVGAVGYGRAIARKCVAAIRHWVPEIGIIAVTGITKPEYAIEYLMLGADIVEISSGIWFYGANIIEETVRFMEKFLEKCGYNNIDDIKGAALKHTVWDPSEYDFRYGELIAQVNEKLCTGCGRCTTTICFALKMEDKIVKVDEEYCVGCGLCQLICPKNAIKIVLRKKKKILKFVKNHELLTF